MKNQLQKDIETALEWYKLIPADYTDKQDTETYNRLKNYINNKGTEYLKYDMRTIIKEAIEHERTNIGKNTFRQLLEAIQ